MLARRNNDAEARASLDVDVRVDAALADEPELVQPLEQRRADLGPLADQHQRFGLPQPLGEDQEMTSFLLIEYPVGCWYCEMPEVTGIVFVELSPGKTASFTRGLVKVVGELSLNANDPESFLYAIRKAKVTEAD